MNTLPTEYFGPHAKRWTHPDTGVTLSLNPADYARAVDNWAQLQEERREEELRAEAVTAAWDDKALDHPTFNTLYGEKITSETLYGPAPVPEPIRGIRLRFLSMVEDDTFGSIIRPVEQPQPAGRHWRHRRPERVARWFAKFGRRPRLWVATGLVYIIAIIGVAAVAGVIS